MDKSDTDEPSRRTAERLRLALEAARMGTWEYTLATGRVEWSELVEDIFGMARGTFGGAYESYLARIYEADRPRVLSVIEGTASGQSDRFAMEHRITTPSGELRWLECKGRLYRNAQGAPERMLGTVVDITQRKEAEERLRRMEDMFRVVVEDQTEMIVRWLPDGTRTFVNQSYCRTFGKSYDELVGTSFFPLIEPSYRAQVEERIRQLTPASPISSDVHPSVLPDGSITWQEWTDRALFDGEGKLVALQSVGRDVSARVRAEAEQRRVEQALSESEERFRSAMEHSPIGMAISTPDGRYIEVNPALCEIVGYARDELVGKRFHDITHPDDVEKDETSRKAMLRGELETYTTEKRYLHKQGHVRWAQLSSSMVCDERGEPRLFIAQMQDITERKAAEAALEQMYHAQRLESVGRLAGGIAHDFNNLLTVILGQLELMRVKLGRGLSVADHLDAAAEASQSAAALTRQLLLFARKQPAKPSALDVNEVVTRTERMLQRLIGEDVRLSVSVDPELPAVWMDGGQLEQVLLNLAVNAKDAMPAGGVLTIETHATTSWPSNLKLPLDKLPARGFVRLRVSDTGVGMEGSVLAHIFEPFFTTKSVGKGTGIGLATVQRVVSEAGGAIDVTTKPGEGTCFDVYLPATPAPAEALPVLADELPGGQGETIVLVEDQVAVRTVAATQLKLLGYRVHTFESAEEAIEELPERLDEVDLVVTDVVMRGMDGPAMVEILRARRPDLRVLYMSGYTDEIVLARGLDTDLTSLLRKPFTFDTLAHTLRLVLGHRPRAAARGTPSDGSAGVVSP